MKTISVTFAWNLSNKKDRWQTLESASTHSTLKDCVKTTVKFPVCRKTIIKKPGPWPEGDMWVTAVKNQSCRGHENCGTILTVYTLLRTSTPEPGTLPRGAGKRGLPTRQRGGKKSDGAWKRKLTFTGGTSLTTGRRIETTFVTEVKQTSMTGGPHGYPVYRVTEHMKALSVTLDD